MTKQDFTYSLINKYIQELSERKSGHCVDIEKMAKNDCDDGCQTCRKEYYHKMQKRMIKQYDESEDEV